jgi:F-type H+-transporting ATPase subunit b
MPFDWFTVIAQGLNFIILLWLLKRFLYKPILDGLDARETRLKKVLDDANDKNDGAEKQQKEYDHKLQQLEQQRTYILKQVHDDAEQERKTLFLDAQQAADDMLRKRLQSLQLELRDMQHDVLNRNVEEVYATTGKILSDLAETKLEQAMIAKFLIQLNALKGKDFTAFLSALEMTNNLIVVRSAFELTSKLEDEIRQALQTLLSNESILALNVNFTCVPNLIAGLELTVGGWKLAWSVEHYMATLRERMNDVLKLSVPLHDTHPEQTFEHSDVANQK